jgi:response regulator RpfG family c-di-GMP phosphodiesterase
MIGNEKLREIVRLSTELNSIHDVDILLEKILNEARKYTDADAGTIYIRESDELVFSHAQNESLQKRLPPNEKLIYSSFKIPINVQSIAGYVAKTGEILNIPDVYNIEKESSYKFDSHYDVKADYITKSMLTVPLKTDTNEVIGVFQIINSMKNDKIIGFDEDDELFVHHLAITATMILQRAKMTRALLLRMIQMAEMRDPKETGAHVNRVAAYSVEIYERWAIDKGVPRDEIDENRDVLRMAAMLHDVGKVAISDLILKKPAKFTDEEFSIMKTHSYLGAKIFNDKQSKLDEMASIVALTHHENWDGTGYPGYLDFETGENNKFDSTGKIVPIAGEDIPLFGRIVALADVFDALSSKRVYKEAWDENSVLDEIKKMSGKKFDPEIVDAFFKSYEMIKSISKRYPEV